MVSNNKISIHTPNKTDKGTLCKLIKRVFHLCVAISTNKY